MKDLYTRITLMCQNDNRKWLDLATREQLDLLKTRILSTDINIDLVTHMICAYTSSCKLSDVYNMVKVEFERKDEPEKPKSFWVKRPYLFDTDGDHEAKAVYCPDLDTYINVLKSYVLRGTYGLNIRGYGSGLEEHKRRFDRGDYAYCLDGGTRYSEPDWYLFAKVAYTSNYYNDNHEYWSTSTDYKISVTKLSDIKNNITEFLKKFEEVSND